MASFSLVSATGMLGSGYQPQSIDKAIALGAQMIGCDAGSTDAGPSHLATGVPFFSKAAVKRDTFNMLTRAIQYHLPLVIGSAGFSGSDQGLEWMSEIVLEIARENNLHFRMAKIHSELSKETVHAHLRDGKSRPLPPAEPLTLKEVDESLHIVGMMGVEPIQKALDDGAQVVICGRSSDTSIFSALPLRKGFKPEVVWHMAKILECGAAAVAVRTAPDSMMATLHDDAFDVFPLREDYWCTPQSIASHTLYENADPFELTEPSGTLYTRDATYSAISDRAVRVSGSKFVRAKDYTIKLEGARLRGYSTIILGGVRDPYIIGQLDAWLAQLDKNIRLRLGNTVGNAKYEIITRVYGRDGVMGELEPERKIKGHEVAILWDVISESQALSNTIATSLSHMAIHNPIPKWHGLITGVALPFSPGEVNRGPVHEFHLKHVLLPETPTSLFPIEMIKV